MTGQKLLTVEPLRVDPQKPRPPDGHWPDLQFAWTRYGGGRRAKWLLDLAGVERPLHAKETEKLPDRLRRHRTSWTTGVQCRGPNGLLGEGIKKFHHKDTKNTMEHKGKALVLLACVFFARVFVSLW